ASSTQNMSAPNVGFTSGSGTTSQTIGVQYSTTFGAQGSTSTRPILATILGSGGMGSSGF
ncbi:hypothetical protein KI387_038443, partial [Taxus chinensis]